MNNFPRRSPRLQQQSQNTYPNTDSSQFSCPSISQSSSASSTSHPSPTCDTLNPSGPPQQYPSNIQPQFLVPPTHFDAPLPSPSANEPDPFGRSQYHYSHYSMGGQAQNQNTTTSSTSNNNNHNQSQPQSAFAQHHNSFSQPQRPNYPPTSVNGVPPGLPADFLAEAAKRAQMACLMRDLGDVSL